MQKQYMFSFANLENKEKNKAKYFKLLRVKLIMKCVYEYIDMYICICTYVYVTILLFLSKFKVIHTFYFVTFYFSVHILQTFPCFIILQHHFQTFPANFPQPSTLLPLFSLKVDDFTSSYSEKLEAIRKQQLPHFPVTELANLPANAHTYSVPLL